jgi:hypothetical protein
VKKHDYRRVFLTELLPYEVPLVFHIEGWKRFCSLYNEKDDTQKYYIPFNYDIRKGHDDFRTLSLIHPLQCNAFAKFYEDFADYIVYLCSRQTKISLRYPAKITSIYHSENAKHVSDEVIEIDDEKSELIEYVKFFTYKKFDGIHNFFESPDYQRLEKKYMHCFICDISKCFYSIYTHTISWAIKNKEIAKENLNGKKTFDYNFDKLMQKANYNETHGIIVGPEISRIFAEIIFQRIDNNVIYDLMKQKYVFDRDYTIRRYVDDYYIYYNDMYAFENIYKILQKRLQEYKLTINESKTQHLTNPFITKNTMAKNALSALLTNYFQADALKKLNFHESQKIITQIKTIIATYSIPYNSIVNYVLAALDRIIMAYITDYLKKSIQNYDMLYDKLEAFFTVYFFMYNMDIRVDTTNKLAGRILETLNALQNANGFIDNFIQLIMKEMEQCFDRIKTLSSEKVVSIETINYIYTLLAIQDFCDRRGRKLNLRYYFDKLFINNNTIQFTADYFSSFNYFEIIVFIHCYNQQKDKMEILKKYLLENYFPSTDIMKYAEAFYLFIDIQSCQYTCFDNIFKKKIFDSAAKQHNQIICNLDFSAFTQALDKTQCSFTEWDISLNNMLKRLFTKKLHLEYDR